MQQSPTSQPLQQSSTSNQQSVHPAGYKPPPPGASPAYRPPFLRPGMQSSNGAIPISPHPGFPANTRPGFIPPQHQQRPLMRPITQSPVISQTVRPAIVGSPIAAASTVPRETSVSPTTQHTEIHKKKRMYPEQITKAYSGEAPTSPAYASQQSYASPTAANQQSQFVSPMGIQPPNFQQQQPYPQPQISNIGYNAYGKDSVSQITSQFGSMNIGPAAHTVSSVLYHFYTLYLIQICQGFACSSLIRSPSSNCRY